MNEVLAQSDTTERLQRLIFVGSLWPIFWGVVAVTCLLAMMWLVIIDGILRRRFGLILFLKAVACLWVGVIATALATSGTDVGPAGIIVMGLVAVGLVIYLYSLERRFVRASTGITLTILRLMLIVVLFAMMAEPIVAMNQTETKKRRLAVLADESVSMDVVDRHMTDGERLRLADALGELSELARPIRLEAEATALNWIQHQLDPFGQWLTDVVRSRQQHDAPTSPAEKRRQDMYASFQEAVREAERVAEVLSTVLEDRQTIPRESVGDLIDLKSRLTSQVVAPMRAIAERIGDRQRFEALTVDQVRGLIASYEDVQRGLSTVSEAVKETARGMDEAFARRADAETHRAMARVGELSRKAIVARLLEAGRDGLLGRLVDEVDVRYYALAREGRAMGLAQVIAALRAEPDRASGVAARPTTTTDTATATPPTTQSAEGSQEVDARSLTDLASALDQVTKDVPLEQLAGVIVLSDGQHNAAGDPLQAAQTLGSQNVCIYPVTIGARQAPTDAAILKLDVADVVHTDDTMDVSVSIRADGLGGTLLRLRLLDDAGRSLTLQDEDERGREIEQATAIKEKTVSIATDHERHEVRLSHKPAGKGRQVYRVVMDTLSDEVFKENNEQVFAVDVTDETTKVLIVDGLPRWEFRYLRNLLARDESVRLQHVLFDPALIARQPELKQIPARVTNESPEADRLPDTAEDLNAFDVVILGDVGPDDLPRDKQQMIERFVADRGGTLVVTAGKRHMPTDYAGRTLAKLLPVQFSQAGVLTTTSAPSRAEGFHLCLTSEGAQHMVTELAVEPQANRDLWSALPVMFWRSPIHVAKGGASVLAWARPVSSMAEPPVRASTQRAAGGDRPDPQRRNAMLVAQNYGLGKVLYIAWDATWRFRYKHGDKYHHKFWGQVLRWATMGKLPAGLKLVKIGTDKARYNEREPVVVRAKFTKLDFTPMTDAEVRAVVCQGEQTITSVRLNYVPGSPGMYEAGITGLPRGRFSVTLESPQIDPLRQRDDPPGEVSTTIVVEATQSAERLELAANTQLMSQLADVSGGVVIEPTGADQLRRHVPTDPIVKHIHHQVTVWDKWWLLLTFGGIVGVEWVLRKRAGLM